MILSIIVPVYQVEQYLNQCLDSILKCDLRDCEILLSIGNSTDKSNQICKEYAERHEGIHILKQNGRGLSNARNCAMRIATGDYLLFADSDDYIIPENLDRIIAGLRTGALQADVIAADFYQLVDTTGQVTECFQIGKGTPAGYNQVELLSRIFRMGQSCWTVWRYIYRHQFLKENRLCFLENTLAEDMDFTSKVLLAKPELLFSYCPYYVYRAGRENSLSYGLTLKRFSESIEVD